LADTRAEAANYGRDKWEDEMATYGKKAQETVKEVMEKFKKGELKSGKDGEIVTDRKQAVAIGLSEAREKGAKVPEPPKK
jgi:mevalonate pyrophosphate decarboxylase